MKMSQYSNIDYDWFQLLDGGEIIPTDLLVLSVIENLCRNTGECTASNEYIAKTMHLSISTVKRSITKLAEKEVITCRPVKGMGKAVKRRAITINSVKPAHEPNKDEVRLTNEASKVHESDMLGSQMQDARLKDDNFSDEKPSDLGNNSSLKEKRKEKEYNIENRTPADAAVISSASADRQGASHLGKEKPAPDLNNQIIKYMYRMIGEGKVELTGLLIKHTKECDEQLLSDGLSMIDMARYAGLELITDAEKMEYLRNYIN
jgi:hypothetical protein